MLTPKISSTKKATGLRSDSTDAADEKSPLLGKYAAAEKPTSPCYWRVRRSKKVGWLGRLFGASDDVPMQQCGRADCRNLCPTLENGVSVPFCSIACTVFALGNEPNFAVCRNTSCVRRCFTDDDGNEHPFCSRSCARMAANPNGRKCARDGCNHRVYTNPTEPSKTYAYCTRNCFYLSCVGTETKLTPLKSNDHDYKLVKDSIPGAKVKKVIRVHMPEDQVKAYLNKRAVQGDMDGRCTRRVYAHAEIRCSGLRSSCGKKLCKGRCPTCDVLRRGFIQNGTKVFERNATIAMAHGLDEVGTRSCCFSSKPLRAMIVADVCAVKDNNRITAQGPCSLAEMGILPRFVVFFK